VRQIFETDNNIKLRLIGILVLYDLNCLSGNVKKYKLFLLEFQRFIMLKIRPGKDQEQNQVTAPAPQHCYISRVKIPKNTVAVLRSRSRWSGHLLVETEPELKFLGLAPGM
jgi:hypothetical protein